MLVLTVYTLPQIISDTSGTTIGTAPYTESLKRRRKAASTALNRRSVAMYIPHIDRETQGFLKEALSYGKMGEVGIDPAPLFLRMNMSISLTLHWGARMESQSDTFREIVHVEDKISNFRSTTGNLQDYVPLLRLNLFSQDSAEARSMRNRRDKYISQMDRDLDQRMRENIQEPCIRANVKTDRESKLNDNELMSMNLTMLAAGLDTMNSAVSWGIAMLATMPAVQEKAARAIQERYGDNPLCDAADDQSLEYPTVMIKEILRFVHVPIIQALRAN